MHAGKCQLFTDEISRRLLKCLNYFQIWMSILQMILPTRSGIYCIYAIVCDINLHFSMFLLQLQRGTKQIMVWSDLICFVHLCKWRRSCWVQNVLLIEAIYHVSFAQEPTNCLFIVFSSCQSHKGEGVNVCHCLWAAQHGLKARPASVIKESAELLMQSASLTLHLYQSASCTSTDVSLHWMVWSEFHT